MSKLSVKEARKKYLASLTPEKREELERKKLEAEAESRKRWKEIFEQNKELFQWFDDGMKANAHHEKAIKVLLESLRTAANHQDMTPEIKEVVDALIIVIEDRKLFEYDLEAVLFPLIEIVEKDTQSKSGSHAVTIRHEKTKKEREAKISQLREIWASGKYSTRDLCAEEEYQALGFPSFGSARKALRNTPPPKS
ncbi:MAG: hypothetical protein H6936_01305 [Burkholderiales bacterium]|nr:hypothetical protein [Burkholderiales bacterium]